jgi:hypothetical protein
VEGKSRWGAIKESTRVDVGSLDFMLKAMAQYGYVRGSTDNGWSATASAFGYAQLTGETLIRPSHTLGGVSTQWRVSPLTVRAEGATPYFEPLGNDRYGTLSFVASVDWDVARSWGNGFDGGKGYKDGERYTYTGRGLGDSTWEDSQGAVQVNLSGSGRIKWDNVAEDLTHFDASNETLRSSMQRLWWDFMRFGHR